MVRATTPEEAREKIKIARVRQQNAKPLVMVSCSQCGCDIGWGNFGYSSCPDHWKAQKLEVATWN